MWCTWGLLFFMIFFVSLSSKIKNRGYTTPKIWDNFIIWFYWFTWNWRNMIFLTRLIRDLIHQSLYILTLLKVSLSCSVQCLMILQHLMYYYVTFWSIRRPLNEDCTKTWSTIKHIPKCIEYNLSASSFFQHTSYFHYSFRWRGSPIAQWWESLTYFFWRCNFSRRCLDDRNTDVCIPWHYLIIKVFSFFLSFWIVTSNSFSSSIDRNVFREINK